MRLKRVALMQSLIPSLRGFSSFDSMKVNILDPVRQCDLVKTSMLREKHAAALSSRNEFSFDLLYDEAGHLSIRPSHKVESLKHFKPFSIDFTSGKMGYRSSHVKDEMIVKALKKFDCSSTVVWDMTAGLGRDSFVLACAGFRVVMFEKSVVIAELLADGLSRLSLHDKESSLIASRMDIYNVNSSNIPNDVLSSIPRPNVCLLDPMFPAKKKSAHAKKDMQILQRLLECESEDGNGKVLLDAAFAQAPSKVVVKRPINGQPLVDRPKPNYSLEVGYFKSA